MNIHFTNTNNPVDFPKMNSLIKQFAEEAEGTKKHVPAVWQFYDHELEKFAELIVRECINEIHVADVGDLKGKGYYLDKVAEHIEKHFGVEE